ncbi:MAG: acylphosphatase [Pseudomonadota bacterium]|nr:acylphosphatase [Desulfobacterales bacterium]MBU0698535.1 acylphosphatase [Pseudomonadota bacterium]
MEKKVRAHVIITGRVQGVFFRYATMQAAEERGVFGWVKNLRNGSVEALFEGSQENVVSMLEWCKQGPPLANVKHVEVEWEEFAGEFSRFEITY